MNDMDRRPLGEVLARVGTELLDAAESVDDLHVLVDAAVKNGGGTDLLLQRAQTIDLLQQHLVALAEFVHELSASTPASWRIESGAAMKKMKLSRLRERLIQTSETEIQEPHLCGDMHLF